MLLQYDRDGLKLDKDISRTIHLCQMLEVSTIEADEMPPPSQYESPSQYELIKERIKSALDQFKYAGILIERFPCQILAMRNFLTDLWTFYPFVTIVAALATFLCCSSSGATFK